MPQSLNANAFRHRAERLGYREIVIEKISDLDVEIWYLVTVREPLAGNIITFVCSDSRLKKMLKRDSKKTKNT